MILNTRKNGFHESYYEHACLVVTERDVLDIDITGITAMTSLQRRWYDLFLLSYTDERASDYYHSTHGMREARRRHFQRHRGSIHPLSKFRNFWDMFILHVVILHQILIYLINSILLQSVSEYTCYCAMVLEVFIFYDIFVNARTGFIHKSSRKIELDEKLIVRNYRSKKLFFHAASSIPLAFIMFMRYGNEINCTLCKANNFNCFISFLTIINLFRVYELSSFWTRDRTSLKATVFFRILRIIVNINLIVIQFLHYSDTISLCVVMKTEKLSAPTYNDSFFDNIFELIHIEKANISGLVYLNAHFWRVVNFLGRPSFGTIIATSRMKYAIIYPHPLMMFIAYGLIMISTGWLLVEIIYFVTRFSYFEDEILKSEQYLSNLVKAKQLTEKFHSDMKDCFDFPATKMKVMEIKNGLNKSLPKVLRDEIAWQSYSRLLLRIPWFSDWPKTVVEHMIVLITERIYLERNIIAEVGAPGEGLMLVDTGVLVVYSLQGKEEGHLIDGDYFGELSLVTDREVRTSSIVSATKCKVLLLEKVLFRQMMRSYPDLFYSLREELKKEFFRDKPQAFNLDQIESRNAES
ncbi:potassium/sodium hyperpolarization-activated cyclic nucleotide-gated channel 1-like [Plodia interpunctella]|uniref:potassium/sodium hyperpolarization-activated cyclic nucleotide-gated channel 1-like n=1 Tax=Plodia interpunctella TaxID=58824 RepID=UPI0023682E0D|nr:potassium/sodium hyperpolarization-activated cyclic nucleotide-gated channel 1-like [Plodia interpunctella]